MIKIENAEVMGWNAAIRGMRNPMNSWEKGDTFKWWIFRVCEGAPEIGPDDYDLMKRLRNAGTDHRKFMRMITVYADIAAPLYLWKEFDTYKVGTVANSCSTMHKIHAKEFTLEDFSHEHMTPMSLANLTNTVNALNIYRNTYLYGGEDLLEDGSKVTYEPKSKDIWWQMIQLLPSSYNQRRTVMLNYEVLANMYKSRCNHKLDEWREMCEWIEQLPYSELITGKERKEQ